VLDEPTTGLDKHRRHILADTLRVLMSGGVGILLICHDREFADALGAEIRIIDGGRLIDA
jgi:energy-coupling factor transport system ATP-binding protein